MFHSVTCRLKETVDSPTPSVEKSKSDPVIQGNLKVWFKTFNSAKRSKRTRAFEKKGADRWMESKVFEKQRANG